MGGPPLGGKRYVSENIAATVAARPPAFRGVNFNLCHPEPFTWRSSQISLGSERHARTV